MRQHSNAGHLWVFLAAFVLSASSSRAQSPIDCPGIVSALRNALSLLPTQTAAAAQADCCQFAWPPSRIVNYGAVTTDDAQDLGQSFVTCSGGRVVQLHVVHLTVPSLDFRCRNCSLTGSLPSWISTAWPNLEQVDLEDNSLTGAVDVLGQLPLLKRVTLSKNRFSGDLGWLANLTMVEQLRLNSNSFTLRETVFKDPCQIPFFGAHSSNTTFRQPSAPLVVSAGLARKLIQPQQLFRNRKDRVSPITTAGTIPFFTNNPRLTTLSVGGNRLEGLLPDVSTNNNLTTYVAQWNPRITGSIPPSVFRLARLRTLALDYCNITGGLSPSLGDQFSLRDILVNNNPALGGVLPDLSKLVNLATLDLSNTDLAGPLMVSNSLCRPSTSLPASCMVGGGEDLLQCDGGASLSLSQAANSTGRSSSVIIGATRRRVQDSDMESLYSSSPLEQEPLHLQPEAGNEVTKGTRLSQFRGNGPKRQKQILFVELEDIAAPAAEGQKPTGSGTSGDPQAPLQIKATSRLGANGNNVVL
ncbi:L domain-like protein [Gonapodya prolifera JEL478]|uniref:L domain-like protein n=1 Tax=Gonapodya prolifera (strain JEL478) TaxID=1344416 RepID=A0A139AX28_GONPJ|nr:L domain-like protein [Gonapodya prolifera JEL478]|eukprot:KXS21296.1 L domain-like protein [Gonapodya prolifera JEL478]